eukprot:c27808_g1_i1 orf=433-2574(+)
MGCSDSKIESVESVVRCRTRNRFIKEAVQHRHAFAAAHAAYTQSLKNFGAALRQFGEGEAKDNQSLVDPNSAFVPTPPSAVLPPPPPPPPPAYPSSPPHVLPLARAVSLPSLARLNTGTAPEKKPLLSSCRPITEEEEKDLYVSDAPAPPRPPSESHAPPPPPPPRNSPWEIFDVFNPQSSYEVDEAGTSNAPAAEFEHSDGKKVGEENEFSGFKVEKRKPEEHGQQIVQEKPLKKAPESVREMPEFTSSADKKERKELQLIVPPKSIPSIGKDPVLVLREIDDLFLAAFESGKEVSRLLETRRIHYHSNVVDGDGITDHYTKVLSAMSWTRPDSRNSFPNEEKETHASTLDKLLAWEKKLYDEVKTGEVIRMELEKKSTQLKIQKQRGEDAITISKMKAVIKSLQTRYLVEFQAVDAASLEVQKLRDDHLYAQLVNLAEGLGKMWKSMLKCHQQQCQIIGDVTFLDKLSVPDETTDFHRKNTLQLEEEINLWHQKFEKMLITQKEYMNALHAWLRLNIIQIESEVKDKSASPQNMVSLPIYVLCKAWIQALDQLPGNAGLQSLKTFSGLIHELVLRQVEELKQKKNHGILSKEFEKKLQSLMHFERKHTVKHVDRQVSGGEEEPVQLATVKNPIQERKVYLDALKKRVEEEREKHEKLRLQSRNVVFTNLRTGLPPVFNAFAEFASACSETYFKLHELTVTGKLPQNLQLGH